MKQKENSQNVVVIVGPTSIGKTKVASEILKRYDGELINSDKFYLYRGFRVGSGLTDTFEVIKQKKHLFEILNPFDNILSVSKYTDLVEQCAVEILGRNKLPLIEGSSVTYNIALSGLNNLASRNFYYQPIIGLRWSANNNSKTPIRSRVEKMFGNGLIEETSKLLSQGLQSSFCLTKGVVYKPVVKYLMKEFDLEQTKDVITSNIQNLANEQLQRLESLKDIIWVEHNDNRTEQTINDIISIVR